MGWTRAFTGLPSNPSDRSRIAAGPSLRMLLWLGFAGVFLVWLLSAYTLARRMVEADELGAAIRSRFLQNERLLATVRAQTLLSSVYLRDAVLDTTPTGVTSYRDSLLRIRREIEQSLIEYVPSIESAAEREQWLRLQKELNDYWNSMMPVLAFERTPSAVEARRVLRDEIIPKREGITRISDGIHEVNQRAFEQAQTEVARVRQGLRRRVWQTSVTAALLGLVIAVVAARYAGRLEQRIREQHAHEVEQKQQLERLSSELMRAQEEERGRIARELHDEIGQALTALKLELAVAERQESSLKAGSALSEARSITDRALQSVRDISQLLHPSMLDDLGLPDTANWYLGGFSRRTGIASELVIQNISRRIAPELEVCTYRVIQEATTNVARHAQATSCRVEIKGLSDALHVTIEDDGKGFDPRAVEQPASRGLGLVSIRERVARLGGSLRVDSHTGEGTRVMVELPMPGG